MAVIENRIVVGIADRQADAVLLVAAAFAQQFDAELVCVVADPDSYTSIDAAGNRTRRPIDPDGVDLHASAPDVGRHVRAVLGDDGPRWTVREVAGEPSAALARLAQEVDALMIVIGTSRRTVRTSVREFFAGSIAAHLAHRQHRPILVVPLDPVGTTQELPWDDAR